MSFFDYFQVASVSIFLFIILSRAIYMNISRKVNPIVIGSGKKGLVLVIELLSFAGLVVWIIEVLLYAFHSDFRIFSSPLDMRLIDSPAARVIGVALVSLGLIIFVIAFVSFGDSWRVGFDMKKPGTLVTNGIFAVTRNPIYLFMDLWFFGIFLINGTLIFLIFAVLTAAAVHRQILQEETFCSKLYGKPYQDYCAQTPRYFGW